MVIDPPIDIHSAELHLQFCIAIRRHRNVNKLQLPADGIAELRIRDPWLRAMINLRINQLTTASELLRRE